MTREEIVKHLEYLKIAAEIDAKPESINAEFIGAAIKIIKQEPCEDAISRQAVLDLIEHYNSDGLGSVFYGYEEGVKFADAVNKLPSVTPPQRWIPVSERMPEEHTSVIGTTEFNDIYEAELYNDCGKNKWYADGNYDVPIVAWMPLPEPYKAESEEK